MLHNTFGIALAEQVFGLQILMADGQRVFVRDIARQHVLEDLGFIPTLADCFKEAPVRPWMARARKGLSAANVSGTKPELTRLAAPAGQNNKSPNTQESEETHP